MQIKKMPIARINPARYNPRKDLQPGDPEYEKLKRSIQEFDLVEPLIWNKRTGNLIGGHQRLKVLQELGYTETEVSVVDLPEDKEKALNIALNKISGDWDYAMLKDLLEELDDTELTGFDMDEVDEILNINNDPVDIDDLLNELDMNKAVDRPIWITARTGIENIDIFEKAAKILEKHGIRVERSYAVD